MGKLALIVLCAAAGVSCKHAAKASALCSDHRRDGDESDVDCGGNCAPCSGGASCGRGSDCAGGVCAEGKCVSESCSDGLKNGSETGIDCGGGCPGCGDGTACDVAADCDSGICTSGLCAPPPALVATPLSITVNAAAHRAFQFAAQGGVAPLTWSVASGPGAVDASGTFTADGHAGATQLAVKDKRGTTVTVSVMNGYSLTNRSVNAVVEDTGALFLGGGFSALFPDIAPGLIALDPASGDTQLAFDVRSGFDGHVNALAVSGGSMYVGGDFANYRGQPAPYVAKLDLATGALDTAFAPQVGGAYGSQVLALAVDDTSLYIAGNFSLCHTAAESLCKVDLASGARDDTFTQAFGVDDGGGDPATVRALLMTDTGLYVAGNIGRYRGTIVTGMVKVTTDTGDLAPGFVQPALGANTLFALATDGTWIDLGGFFSTFGVATVANLVRFEPVHGTLDTDFSKATGFDSIVGAIAVDASGVYVGGSFSTYRTLPAPFLAKLTPDGTLDQTFTQNSDTSTFLEVDTLLLSGTSLYVSGGFASYRGQTVPQLMKLDTALGNVDATFTQTTGVDGVARALVMNGGTLYAGGSFVGYRGVASHGLARLDTPGLAPNTAFTTGLGTGVQGTVAALVEQSGSLYVGGTFSKYQGHAMVNVAKVGPDDASLDQGFSTSGCMTSGSVAALATNVSSLYIAGSFNPAGGLCKASLTTGARDSGFADVAMSAFTGNDHASALALSSDSVFAGGSFSKYYGASVNALIKVGLTSGTIDPAFNPSGGFDASSSVTVLALDSSLGLFAGGTLIKYLGNAVGNAISVSPTDGSVLAGGFTSASGADDTVESLCVIGSSVYLGGRFSSYRGSAAGHIAKVNATDGTLDGVFAGAGGFNEDASFVAATQEGVLVGGTFTSYGGVPVVGAVPLDPTTGSLP